MSKFKIGDKVVVGAADTGYVELLRRIQGVKDYHTVTRTSARGYWLQLDGVNYLGDPVPWCAEHFELYQEPDDELPPIPNSVYYPDMYTLLTGLPVPKQVDHINGIRDDNRWINLRAATNSQNQYNRKPCSSSGNLKGAYYKLVLFNQGKW